MNEQEPIFNHKASKLYDALGMTQEQFETITGDALGTAMEVAKMLGLEGRTKSEAVEVIYKNLVGSCSSFKEAAVFVFALMSVMAGAFTDFMERR